MSNELKTITDYSSTWRNKYAYILFTVLKILRIV